jgi:hypothetical protein
MRTRRRFAGFGRQSRPAYPAGKSPSGGLLGPLGRLRDRGAAAAGGGLDRAPALAGLQNADDASVAGGVLRAARLQALQSIDRSLWPVCMTRKAGIGSKRLWWLIFVGGSMDTVESQHCSACGLERRVPSQTSERLGPESGANQNSFARSDHYCL